MNYEDKVIRAKRRIEYLRKIHGLKKKDIHTAMGFSKQHYHNKYQDSPVLAQLAINLYTRDLEVLLDGGC